MILLADVMLSSGQLAWGPLPFALAALPFALAAVAAVVAVRFLLPPKR